jgi:hypothetical protein
MNIAQRGTSSTAATGYNVIDRFLLSNINTNTTITQSRQYDGPAGFQYCFEIKNTTDGTPASTAYLECQQRVEAINARAVNQADSFTVSFYYKSNVTGTLPVEIYQRTDANSNWRNWQGLSVTGDETWRRAEFTYTKNSAVAALPKVDNDWGFIVAFNLELGTDYASASNENTWINNGSVAGPNFGLCGSLNDYIRITGLQVELGEKATPFEHRLFGEELSLCQRYYQKLSGEGGGIHAFTGWFYTTTAWSSGFVLPQEMRTKPTVSFDGTAVNQSAGSVGATNWALYVAGNWRGATTIGADLSGSSKTYIRLDSFSNDTVTSGFAGGLYGGDGCAIKMDAEL